MSSILLGRWSEKGWEHPFSLRSIQKCFLHPDDISPLCEDDFLLMPYCRYLDYEPGESGQMTNLLALRNPHDALRIKLCFPEQNFNSVSENALRYALEDMNQNGSVFRGLL